MTDRRMFTADGELRDEYRHLEGSEASAQRSSAPAQPSPEPAQPSQTRERPAPPAEPPPQETAPRGATPQGPAGEADDAPRFSDLIGLLAEPASLYLRESTSAPPQEAAQSLELARLYIDLLTLLQQKTKGNLDAREQAMLDDVVYQLRSGYVGMRR